jgi:hypothetical protein
MDVAHGPGTLNVDQTLSKHFKLGERRDIQLRAECYNIMNHASFYQMNVAAQFNAATLQQSNALFGRETNTLTPRVMQIALRFMF